MVLYGKEEWVYLLGDNGCADNGFVDGRLPILSLLVSLVPQLRDVVEDGVRAYHFESDVDAEKCTSFFHDHPGVKTWPDADVVSVEGMSLGRIEHFWTDLLKS